MRKLSIILGLIAAVGCSSGDPVNNPPGGTSVAGTWSLQTYNGGALPYSGSVNANGSINRVDSGSITLDNSHTYVLDIKIVNTLGSTITPQNYAEVGSYAGNSATGVILKPNDLSGGTNGQNYQQIAVTVTGTTLSFPQEGKILTFVKR